MSTLYSEKLREIYASLGGDPDNLPDNLYSTLLTAILHAIKYKEPTAPDGLGDINAILDFINGEVV